MSLLLSISSVGEVTSDLAKSPVLTWQVLSPLPQNLSLFLSDGMLDSPVRQAQSPQILHLPQESIQFCSLSIPPFLTVLIWGRAGSLTPLDPLPPLRSCLPTFGCTGGQKILGVLLKCSEELRVSYGCPINCKSREREKRNGSHYHDADIQK